MESYEVLPSLNFFFKIPPHSGWNEKSGKSFFSTRFRLASKETCYRVKTFLLKFFSGKKGFGAFLDKFLAEKVRSTLFLELDWAKRL